MNLRRIEALARELLEGRHSPDSNEKGEKFFHGQRVATLALTLRRRLYPDDSSHDEILTAAAWFHDILNGETDHSLRGAERVRELLAPHCNADELDEICAIIRVHDDRSPALAYSRYVQLHQDADHLDHFGVYDVWRAFIYAIPHEQTMPETLEWMARERPKLNERFRKELHFELSKRIFDEKMDFLDQFTKRFEVECSGGIWDAERLLAGDSGAAG